MQQDTAISLLGGDSVDDTSDFRSALPINMVAINKEILNAKGYLLMHSGLTFFASGEGIDRGAIWNQRMKIHFRVSGQKLIAIDAGGSTVVLGAIEGLDSVSMPYSFNTQAIVADGRYYLYDPVGGFREVVDIISPPAPPEDQSIVGDPIDAVFLDGYYVFIDEENVYHTNLTNEAKIDALSFGTAEISPDPNVGLGVTVDNKLMIFGRYSIEYMNNVATENFAFSRIPSRAIKTGLIGTHAKVQIENVWYFMGGRKESDISIYAVTVGMAEMMSSREVNKVLNKYSEDDLADAVLEGRVEDDQHYLIVHLQHDSLMFNIGLAKVLGLDQAWTRLKSDVQSENPWRGKHGVFDPRLAKFVYGDRQNQAIGILDDSVTTHYEHLVEYAMFTPFIQLEEMSIDEVQVDTIAGYTKDKDATVAISITYDGEHYSREWWAHYGLPSEYQKRFIARRLGYIRHWFALKFRIASRSRMAFALCKIKFS